MTPGAHGFGQKPAPVSGAPADSAIVRQTPVLSPTSGSLAPVKDQTLRAGTRGRAFTAPEQAQVRSQRANSVVGAKSLPPTGGAPAGAANQVAGSVSPAASMGAAVVSGAKAVPATAPRAVRRARPVDPTLGRAPAGGGLALGIGSVSVDTRAATHPLRNSMGGPARGVSQNTPIVDARAPSTYVAEHSRRPPMDGGVGGGDAGVDGGTDGGRNPSNDLGY